MPEVRPPDESPTLAFQVRPEAPNEPEPDFVDRGYGPLPDGLPQWIGPYRLLDVLGQGGMGTVLLAQQSEPLERLVALKLIRAGRLAADSLRRFDLEARALARMSHPDIAKIYEVGRGPDGQPYLAMEHVPGEPITAFCSRRESTLVERLELFARVCDGVQHAHEKAILHRDLKPSNVLVVEQAGEARPKIIDFGIAKTLDRPEEGEVRESSSGSSTDPLGTASGPPPTLLGTLAYLSPEALRSAESGEEPDTRSDVYSLGVLLCELLAGTLPFRAKQRQELARKIVEDEILPPSQLFAALQPRAQDAKAGRRGKTPAGLRKALRGDLDAIVLKAMARDRARRYPSAAELAADVRRWLKREPVLAMPQTALYRAGKLLRRHWVVAAAGLFVAASLVAGITARSLEAARANREAERANREAEASRRVADFLVGLFETSNPKKETRRDVPVSELLDRGTQRLATELRDEPVVRARLLDTLGAVYQNLGHYPKAEALLRESLSLRRTHLGAAAPEVGDTERTLASLYRELGRSDEAERLLADALRIPGQAPMERSKSLMELASLERDRNHLDAAERHLLEALAIRERLRGPEHEDVASALNNLANLYYDRKRFAEAEKVHLRALAIKRKTLGPDNFLVAQSLNNLANVYIEMKRLPEAEALQVQALAIKRKSLPPEHFEIGVSLLNLGEIAYNQQRYDRAESYYRQALAQWRKGLPEDHPYFAYAEAGLANVARDTGRWREAEAAYGRALAVARKTMPLDGPVVTTIEADWAKLKQQRAAAGGRG